MVKMWMYCIQHDHLAVLVAINFKMDDMGMVGFCVLTCATLPSDGVICKEVSLHHVCID
jgi:hypothetical protein